MKIDNPLDRHLEFNRSMPEDVRLAAIHVSATLDVAWLAAQSVFEDRATPDLALAIYDRMTSWIQAQPSLLELLQRQGIDTEA